MKKEIAESFRDLAAAAIDRVHGATPSAKDNQVLLAVLDFTRGARDLVIRPGAALGVAIRPGGDRRPLSSTTTMVPKLDEIGVTRDQSSRYQKLAEIPQPVFEETVEALKERGDLSGASVKRVADIVGDVAEEDLFKAATVMDEVVATLEAVAAEPMNRPGEPYVGVPVHLLNRAVLH